MHITSYPTEKAKKLLDRIASIGSKPGDTILDPFMGSGTTGVIAKRLGRAFVGIEIDDNYFEIAQKRITSAKLNKSLFDHCSSQKIIPVVD